MLRIMFIYGALAGAAVVGAIVLGLAMGSSTGDAGVWLGYLIMLVALSLVFVGVKRYRDATLGGTIRFGTALGVGLGIAAVAAVVYVIGWEINLFMTDYQFINDYTAGVIEAKRASGASAAELAQLETDMAAMRAQYAKPAFRLGTTFMEIFPVGAVVALASAAALRNSRLLRARG
jgi:uncharacterized membrane protein YhaH (DUF805 family)